MPLLSVYLKIISTFNVFLFHLSESQRLFWYDLKIVWFPYGMVVVSLFCPLPFKFTQSCGCMCACIFVHNVCAKKKWRQRSGNGEKRFYSATNTFINLCADELIYLCLNCAVWANAICVYMPHILKPIPIIIHCTWNSTLGRSAMRSPHECAAVCVCVCVCV